MDTTESTLVSQEEIFAGQLLPHEQEFANTLERLNSLPIRELPHFAEEIDHTGNVIAPTPYSQLESGIYLNQQTLDSQEGEDSYLSPNLTFSTQPLAEIGRKTQIGEGMAMTESQHGTFFGMVQVETGDQSYTAPVAIKPIDHNESAPVDATRQELAMLEYAAACGLPTLDVLGLVVDNEAAIPRSYILTRRNPEIRSLDTLNWREEAANVDQHLGTAVTTLTALHANMIFHKDLEFKNVSSLDTEGSFVVFDLEWSTSLRDVAEQPGGPDIERLSRAIDFDLNTVRRSMRKILYPNLPEDQRPNTPEEEFSYELAHLYEPYHLAIMNSGSRYSDTLDRAYRLVLERRHNSLSEQRSHQVQAVPVS